MHCSIQVSGRKSHFRSKMKTAWHGQGNFFNYLERKKVKVNNNKFNFYEFIISHCRFLMSCFGLSVQDVTVNCETSGVYVKEAVNLLKKLSNNKQLRKLFLEPTNCTYEWPIRIENEDEW